MPSKLRGPLPAFVAVLAFAGGAAPAAAAQPDAREVARAYLADNAQKFGVSAADFSDLMFTSVYETKGLGVTHVNINQRYRDMEVFGGQITVNVGTDGKVVFAGGQPVSLATVASDAQNLDASAAVAKAALGPKLQAPRSCACCAAPASSRRRPSSRAAGSRRTPIEATLGWHPTRRRPPARLARDHRRVRRRPSLERRRRRQDRRAAQEGRLDLARQPRRAQGPPATLEGAAAGAGLPARLPGQLARAGARRLGLSRHRVAEREPTRRRPHAGLPARRTRSPPRSAGMTSTARRARTS